MADQVLAPKFRDLFFDANQQWIPSDFKVAHGGRGGLKTWGFARVSLMLASTRRTRFLCCREMQNSIQESVHHELVSQIEAFNLGRYFDIQKTTITNVNGSAYIFAGLATDPRKIKSTSGIDVTWVEEAENVSQDSWDNLIPTVLRKPNAEIWVSFNPDLKEAATSRLFLVNKDGSPLDQKDLPPNTRIIKTTYRDNPWFPEKLRSHMEYLARVDPDAHAHVYEGEFRENGDAQVLRGKYVIQAFEPSMGWDGPYQGCDWGNVDPTVMVRLWIHDRCLYVEYEAYKVGADIRELPDFFDTEIPMARQYVTRADNAWPQTVQYVKNAGYSKMESCEKWKGSVEDGVAYLRQFEKIIIHPRCTETAAEARLWSYKVDRISGDVLPDLKSGNDHCWDAARYALQPMIKNPGTWAFGSI